MDPLTLILSVALVGGVLALILYPLWRQTRPESLFQVSRVGQTLEEYQARYQAVLAAIRDLMFDYEMGKVAPEDYELLLTRLKLEAAGYRQQIDRANRSRDEEIAPALNAEIEAMIDRVRHQDGSASEALLREVEVEIELLKGIEFEASGAKAGACPRCGKATQEEDAFCSRCGQPLAQIVDQKEEDEEEEEKHTCPRCGYAFVPGDTFCVKCGAVLDENTASQRYEDARV